MAILRQPIFGDQLVDHRADVAGEPGMVERRSKLLGAAAVAHVHADHVHARQPRLAAGADHVRGFARAFEAVHDHGGQRTVLLPVAVAAHLHAVGDGEEAALGFGQQVAARQEMAGEGLDVAAAQTASRHEIIAQACMLRANGVAGFLRGHV